MKDCIEYAILDGLTAEYSENGEYKLAPSNFPYCSVLHYHYHNKKTTIKYSFIAEYYCKVGQVGHLIVQNVIANSTLQMVGVWECCSCNDTNNQQILLKPDKCNKCGSTEFIYKEINVNYNFNIFGRIDGLLYDNCSDKFTLLEFKFKKSLPQKVLESHKNQILAYCVMLKNKFDIIIDSAYVIYLTIDNPTKIRTFSVNITNKNLIVMKKRLDKWISLYKSIKNGIQDEEYIFQNSYRNLCKSTNFCVESHCPLRNICDKVKV